MIVKARKQKTSLLLLAMMSGPPEQPQTKPIGAQQGWKSQNKNPKVGSPNSWADFALFATVPFILIPHQSSGCFFLPLCRCYCGEDPMIGCIHHAHVYKTIQWDAKHWHACLRLQVGIIKSSLLTRTLFDVYLGRDPVSPDAKQSIGRGLVNLAIEENAWWCGSPSPCINWQEDEAVSPWKLVRNYHCQFWRQK